MSKITVPLIQEELSPDGWKLLSSEYQNLNEELIFECPEGHKVYSSWKKIRNKKFCPVCEKNEYKDQNSSIVKKQKGVNRVLALDQATYVTGWAVFDDEVLVKYGTFNTTLSDDIARMVEIKNWLISMINNWRPDDVGIEGIQYQQNEGVVVFERLARLQGTLLSCLYELNVPTLVCHTATWRHHCGVKGKSRTDRKKSMQLIAKDKFDISIDNDCADAIGIGIYASSICNNKVIVESWE